MSTHPISVVVTVHRGARYLAAALHSILAQPHRPLEVIVVDDGPPDGSERIAREAGPEVRYVRRPDRGPGAAKNEGIEMADSEILAFLDQDDLWEPGKLDAQLPALAGGETDAVFGHVREFVVSDLPNDISLRAPAPRAPGWVPGAMLIRRTALERVGPFSGAWRVGEWIEWFARARDAGLEMRMLDEVVLARRLHGENRTLREADARGEYARVLWESLARRRGAS